MLVSAVVILAGCTAKPAAVDTQSPNKSLTGTIQSAGGQYSITVNGLTTQLDSRTVNFSQYVGKTITVTGQYSGTTLFVDTVTQ